MKMNKASDYLYWLKNYYQEHRDMVVILYLRVSGRTQDRNGNRENQERVLRLKFDKLGISVVDCFYEVGSGFITADTKREVLGQAIRKAQQYSNAVIVALSADRFLRNRNFTTDNSDLLPKIAEYEKLKELAENVPLVTLLNPDLSAREVRGYQSRIGQQVKGNTGGRPKKKYAGYKKQRWRENRRLVVSMVNEGASLNQIHKATGIARTTIHNRRRKYKEWVCTVFAGRRLMERLKKRKIS